MSWLKLHRSLTEWEWYDDQPCFRLFMHLLLKANYKPTRYQGIELPAGAKAWGRKELAAQTGLSEQQIRTALNKLKSTHEITIKTTKKFSIISITKWNEYQDSNQEITNNQPTNNQQITTELEYINNKPVASSARESAREHVQIGQEISKITGWDTDPNWFGDYSRIQVWLERGWNPERDIYPTIRKIMARREHPPNNLKYFEPAIADAFVSNTSPLPEGKRIGKNGKSKLKTEAEQLLDDIRAGRLN